jgi:sarcosine oxidase subunit gamma
MIRKERGSMADVIAARAGALDGLAQPGPVLVVIAPSSRFAFRGRSTAIDKAGVALDLPLPREPRRATAKGERAALWLGPNEWLLLAPAQEEPALRIALRNALHGLPHSLVALGHAHAALTVTGPAAEAVLNAGCPLDLDRSIFQVNECTRTVFAKTEIVLWRVRSDCFRVETARSYAAYLWQLLSEAAHEYEFS